MWEVIVIARDGQLGKNGIHLPCQNDGSSQKSTGKNL